MKSTVLVAEVHQEHARGSGLVGWVLVVAWVVATAGFTGWLLVPASPAPSARTSVPVEEATRPGQGLPGASVKPPATPG